MGDVLRDVRAKQITWGRGTRRCRTGFRVGSDRPLQPSIESGPYSQPFGRQDPSLPQVFGRYLLVQRLSRGGMGEIFLAKHGLVGFEKLAVIKKVLPHLAADEQFISRFVDEAQVAIKLQHVNVAQVFEVGRVGNEYFLALEYVDGRDLRRILSLLGHRKRRMPVDLALFIARELANGLAYAHRRTTADGASLNLVHCDISPPNVLVSFEGETKVIDFGIARSAMRATTTDPKLGFGKFGYMAPEQLIRGGVIDYRTDIYAAGVVLFELLTSTRLYEAGPQPDYRALARKVARGEFPLPSHIDRQLAAYDDLVATALRPRPDNRYQSAAGLRDAIQQCLVTVNPTISTDQLGTYMRELFADEMVAQRELHERVASAHLADFREQFHTQTISTVSFALAQLPLQPPEATGPVVRHLAAQAPLGSSPVSQPQGPPSPMPSPPVIAGRTTGSGPAASVPRTTAPGLPSSAVSSVDALSPATESITLGGATLIGGASYAHSVARRRSLLVIAAATAAVVIIAFAAWSLGRSDGHAALTSGAAGAAGASGDDPRAAAAVAPPASPHAGLTVEPIQVAPGAADDGSEIEMNPDDPAPGDGVAAADPAHRAAHDLVHDAAHRTLPRKDPPKLALPPAPPPAPAMAPTRMELGQKFQQVRREYGEYKAKFGSRLEKEWGDLAMFIQYASEDDAWRREAAHRLDEFHAHMRE
jgi:serine/threonine protein kinase